MPRCRRRWRPGVKQARRQPEVSAFPAKADPVLRFANATNQRARAGQVTLSSPEMRAPARQRQLGAAARRGTSQTGAASGAASGVTSGATRRVGHRPAGGIGDWKSDR